ncbi:squalene synthase HpnC [Stieleria varia]|uniref:All-trans-phytoene synthase n=1 Tax=Stieleria varia TaxID=2528005 RepID=A0A5C6AP13_9BACT|nr:squalene synthase HpnC [Stieleria varia]TWU00846.1 All-trans-phytoene synthase [Stieleria varia]
MTPESPNARVERTAEIIASELACRRLAKSHYENFLVATVLLPRRLRQHFYNIYAFCRTADDAADESASPQIALEKLAQLQSSLDATFAGNPPSKNAIDGKSLETDLFPALHHTIVVHRLDQSPFDDLLSAFRQDQSVNRYESTPQLLDYCRRSANPVGRILLKLADAESCENAALSDSLCTGLQLVNFWQDVARDYREINRVYLPADRMRDSGVSENMLNESTTPAPLRSLLAKLCDEAECYLNAGLPLAENVPKWLANDVRMFAQGGLATAKAIRAIDYDVLRTRPVVSKWGQLVMLAKTMLAKTILGRS